MLKKFEKLKIKKNSLELIIFLIFFIFQLNQIEKTNSFFNDQASIKGITFSTGSWDEAGEGEEQLEVGDVVINEIMWMGSVDNENNEWIELKNMTDEEIDISNWRINGAGKGKGENAHLQIPNGYSIKANSYFLILKEKSNKTEINLTEDLGKDQGMDNKSGMDLLDEGEELRPSAKEGLVLDVAWKDNENWPAGESKDGLNKSMQRNLDSGDGKEAENWNTANIFEANGKVYWKSEDKNFGTPRNENIIN